MLGFHNFLNFLHFWRRNLQDFRSWQLWIFLKDFPILRICRCSLYRAVSGNIGNIAKGIEKFGERIVFQMFAHGTSQSLLAGVQGGDMLQSFVSGALSSIVSSAWAGGDLTENRHWKGVGGNFARKDIGILVFGTAAGAGGAALTKGNIWQGAAIGLVVSGLNHLAHSIEENSKIKASDEANRSRQV